MAEAIDSQLGAIVGGLSFRYFTGNVPLDSQGSGVLSFPGFTIMGSVIQLSTHLGGVYRVGHCSGATAGGRFWVTSVNDGLSAPDKETFSSATVTVMVLAWGVVA